MIEPDSKLLLIWDLFIGLLVIYIIIVTPLQIGFDLRDNSSTTGVLIMIVVCYGLDMLIQFNTAYYDDITETVVYNRQMIAKKYFQFWFWPDLISTVPIDIIVQIYYNESNLQIIRMIRFFRLIKLFKVVHVIKNAAQISSSGFNSQTINLIILIIRIFFIAHIFACFWHYITLPQAIGSFPNNWVDYFGFARESVSSRYIASLYFIIVSMLTVGYGDIHATNELERFYAILTMMVGAVVFGALISKVTSLIDKRNPQAREYDESMTEFNYFINETTLPRTLKERAKVR